jgi:catalase
VYNSKSITLSTLLLSLGFSFQAYSGPVVNGALIIPMKLGIKKAYQAEVDSGAANPIYKRDVHVKSHSCVRGTFSVNLEGNSALSDSLKAKLQKGLFKEDGTYNTIIRYSNGGSSNEADKKPDVRGMAIKVAGVTVKDFGKKILSGYKDAETQDFLLMNGKAFFLEKTTEYFKLIAGTEKYFQKNPQEGKIMAGIMANGAKIKNPLTAEFYSATPYALAEEAVKYGAVPCGGAEYGDPVELQKLDRDYLTDAIVESLSQNGGGACFKFMVQVKKGDKMPIEDPRVQWDERVSPYVEVARIEIPEQNVEGLENEKICENLSFTPWHSLPEHEPLGDINEARKSIYKAISAYRRLKNLGAKNPAEPTNSDLQL